MIWMVLDLLLIVSGLALVVAGVAHWSGAAAYVFAGLALVALGVIPLRRRSI